MATRDRILELDRRFVWRPYTAHEEHEARDPLVVASAEGAWLIDVDGRRYLDGTASWWTNNVGHRHPRIVGAIHEQTETLLHSALADATHAQAAQLAEELVAIAPDGLARVFYSDDGSTAVEVALKLAAQYWHQNGRPERRRFVALGGAYHGDTVGTMSVGGVEVFRKAFGPMLFDAVRPPPADDDAGWERAVSFITDLLVREGDSIAAVMVEPRVQGAAGMRFWPAALLEQLRQATLRADVFLIADEVFTGLGRTGPMWASNHANVSPDIFCTAKGLSGGVLPFAATLATARIYEGFRGGKARAFLHGHTFTGNPLGARIAREVLAIYRDERVLEGIPTRETLLANALAGLPADLSTRVLGMVAAVDLGPSGYLEPRGQAVVDAARSLGLSLRPLGNTVYLTPPLTIPLEELQLMTTRFIEAISSVLPR